MKPMRIFLLLILLLPVTWVAAQQVEPAQDAAAPQAETAPDTAAQELVFDEQDDAGNEDDSEDAETEEQSSSRFIPTEQISQDLGVSFPVDI